MKTRFAPLLLCLTVGFASLNARAQNDAASSGAAAAVLVLGRVPRPAEKSVATTAGNSIAKQIAEWQARVAAEPALQREVIVKSFQDARGRSPTDAEMAAPSTGASSYTELMKRHAQWLSAHPDEYEQVMRRVYPLVIHREIYPEEITYWKKQGTLTFVLLVGCVEDWARRNQPGLMVTAGTPTISVNSEFLVTERLSPAAAAEARSAIGLATDADGPDADRHHLIAAGGERLATEGGIYFVAAGQPDLLK